MGWQNKKSKISGGDSDINKEDIILGVASQFGIKLEIHLNDNIYHLENDIVGLDDYLELKESFYCQLAVKDITRDGEPEILLAVGNGLSELYLNAWKFEKYTYLDTPRGEYVNPFKFLGYIEGQEKILIFPDGRIDVPYGSQGLYATYIYNGEQFIKVDQSLDIENLSSLINENITKKFMRCFLIGTKKCSKNIKENESWVFLAYDYNNIEIEKIIENGVNPTLEKNNLEPKIAKKFKVNYDFMCKICQLIQESKYFIADVSDRNFNVGFELGIAVGLGKDTIIIANKNSKETSDLKRTEAIKYSENIEKFQKDLNDMLKHVMTKQ